MKKSRSAFYPGINSNEKFHRQVILVGDAIRNSSYNFKKYIPGRITCFGKYTVSNLIEFITARCGGRFFNSAPTGGLKTWGLKNCSMARLIGERLATLKITRLPFLFGRPGVWDKKPGGLTFVASFEKNHPALSVDWITLR